MIDLNDRVESPLYGTGLVVKIFDNESEPIYGVDFKNLDTIYLPEDELRVL